MHRSQRVAFVNIDAAMASQLLTMKVLERLKVQWPRLGSTRARWLAQEHSLTTSKAQQYHLLGNLTVVSAVLAAA